MQLPCILPQALNRINAQCVPLYDSLGENAIEFIINHSESSIVFVCTTKLAGLAKALPKTKNVLKTIIYWGEGHPASIEVSASLVTQVAPVDLPRILYIPPSADGQVPRLQCSILPGAEGEGHC